MSRRAKNGEPMRWLLAAISHKGNDCLEWPYAKTEYGYGQISIQGRLLMVNRVIAGALFGRELQGHDECVLHSCDNPPCCNPKHLRVGNHTDNAKDSSVRGRIQHGEGHYQAKLDDASASLLRARFAMGLGSINKLARRMGISRPVAHSVIRGKAWKHCLVPNPVSNETILIAAGAA